MGQPTPDPADESPVETPSDAEPRPRARQRRRVTTKPPLGSDPTPAPEPARHSKGENDDRMRGDKPPHY